MTTQETATPTETKPARTVENIGVDDTACHTDGRHFCRRCAGTGAFITGTLNGKPTGPGGLCFRCGGKGYHTLADRKRNWGWTMHQKAF